MISVEELEALDLSLWLQTGELAGSILHCNQSTVSRRKLKALSVFDASLARDRRGWCIQSASPLLLKMEREVHQWNRLVRTLRLRIHIPYWSYSIIRPSLPQEFITNPPEAGALCDNPIELLRARIIDACVLTPTQLKGVPCDDLEFVDLYTSQINLYHVPSPTSSYPTALQSIKCHNSHLLVPTFLPQSCRRSSLERFKQLTGFSQENRLTDGFSYSVAFLTPLMANTFDHAFKTRDQLDWGYKETLVFLKTLASNPTIQKLVERICLSFKQTIPSRDFVLT